MPATDFNAAMDAIARIDVAFGDVTAARNVQGLTPAQAAIFNAGAARRERRARASAAGSPCPLDAYNVAMGLAVDEDRLLAMRAAVDPQPGVTALNHRLAFGRAA